MFYLGRLGEIYDIATLAETAAAARVPAAARLAPDVTNLTSVSSVLVLLQSAENAAASATNAVAATARSGKVPDQYVAAYDALRHQLQTAQRAVLSTLRTKMAGQFSVAKSNEIMAMIPFPAWLPRADFMVSVPAGQSPTFIADDASRAISNLPAHFADNTVQAFVDAAAECIITIGVAKGVKNVVTARSSGTRPSADDLAAFAEAADRSRKRKLAIAIPVVVGVLAIGGGLAWWLMRRRKKAGTSGLSRSRPRRTLRGATRLSTLTDSVPSRYNLEV